MPSPQPDPLILTAALDTMSTRSFQDLRNRHFPAGLNIVPAHLTLFHHLPGDDQETIVADLHSCSADIHSMPFAATELRFLGRGVAIEIDCALLVTLRQSLAQRWAASLGAQDRQRLRPHVTIQNKVPSTEARGLFDRLAASFAGIEGSVLGLDLWHYRGGPWEAAAQIRWGSD